MNPLQKDLSIKKNVNIISIIHDNFYFPVCKRGCTKILRHVCGTNDQTYDNYCLLKKAWCVDKSIKMKHSGKCGGKPYLSK